MTWFVQIWNSYAPCFVSYVLPFFGLAVIAYTIYLVRYLFFGKE